MTRRRALASPLLCAALGGCNLIFGVTGGVPDASSGGAASSSGSTSTSGSSSSTATSSSTSSASGSTSSTGTSTSSTSTSTSSTSTSTSSTSTSSSSGGTGGAAPSVTVLPATSTQLALTGVPFKTTITGLGGGVTWSVLEANGGHFYSPGVYTAPATGGTFHVVATSTANVTVKGEATVTVETSVKPVTIVPTGALHDATGRGSQTHLVYATGVGAWWLFHDPAGLAELAVAVSPDFATWTAGPSLGLPYGHSGTGRDLSIAYTSVGGADVVHITQGFLNGASLGRYHVRDNALPAAAGRAPTTGMPVIVDQGGAATPDGSSTAILGSGLVLDSTGYQVTPATPPLTNCGVGALGIYTSGVLDKGSTSLMDMSFPATPKVLWCAAMPVTARELIAIGNVAIHLSTDGTDPATSKTLFASARTSTGQWNPSDSSSNPLMPNEVFADQAVFDTNDWAAAVYGGSVQVVRRITSTGNFEHATVDSTGAPSAGAVIPSYPTAIGSGLVMAPYGDSLVLFTLDANAGSSVVYSVLNGSNWSPWAAIVSIGTSGSWLSGSAYSGGKPALIWTQPAGSSYAIAGALLP